MSVRSRQQKIFNKKTYYIFSLMAVVLSLLIYSIFLKNTPLLVSPMGESNVDINKVKKNLKDLNISFSQVLVLSDSSYSVSIPNNGQVRFSSGKDIEKQIASLQRILSELTIEGKSFKNIDFRFEEPIISF